MDDDDDGSGGPLAGFYDRMQAARLLKVSRERDSMLRDHSDGGAHLLSDGGGSSSTAGIGSASRPLGKQPAATTEDLSSYVMCTIDGLTYILNPEAEIIIGAGGARAKSARVT